MMTLSNYIQLYLNLADLICINFVRCWTNVRICGRKKQAAESIDFHDLHRDLLGFLSLRDFYILRPTRVLQFLLSIVSKMTWNNPNVTFVRFGNFFLYIVIMLDWNIVSISCWEPPIIADKQTTCCHFNTKKENAGVKLVYETVILDTWKHWWLH